MTTINEGWSQCSWYRILNSDKNSTNWGEEQYVKNCEIYLPLFSETIHTIFKTFSQHGLREV